MKIDRVQLSTVQAKNEEIRKTKKAKITGEHPANDTKTTCYTSCGKKVLSPLSTHKIREVRECIKKRSITLRCLPKQKNTAAYFLYN